ncbi:MAG: hypothetical protein KAV42_05780 [Candidatus Krumholzibacteria bacterium]|nr:hypothetical protein [Candidatus Krumholzibacteria bacterium]
MKKRNRRGLIVLAVVAVLVIAASVTLRAVLSRDRLIALLVPRIEKAVDASISIGDIGIRFPFGFGVNVSDLSFKKDIPGTGDLSVRSARTSVSVSLMSLVRKRPDIEKIDVEDALIMFSGTGDKPDLELHGVRGSFSMQPRDSLNMISADIKIGKVAIKGLEEEREFSIEDVGIRAGIAAALDFNSIDLSEAVIKIGDVVSLDLKAEIKDLSGEGLFSFSMTGREMDLPSLIEWSLETGILEQTGPAESGTSFESLPVEISSGILEVSAGGGGSLLRPSEARLKGNVVITGLSGTHVATGLPFGVDGDIRFAGDEVSSDDLRLKSGDSSIKTRLKVKLAADMKPVRADITSDFIFDLGELAAAVPGDDGIEMAGTAEGKIVLGGKPATLKNLFPGAPGVLDASMIRRGWNDVALDGQLAVKGGALSVKGEPFDLAGIGIECSIRGGSIASLKGAWTIDGRPWSVTGSMKDIFPCLSEMMLLASAAQKSGDGNPAGNGASGKSGSTGDLLDSIRNRPAVSLELNGRYFDARPLQRKEKQAAEIQEEAAAGGKKESGGTSAEKNSFAGAAPFLLNTLFTCSLDTLITEKAVFTSIRAGGSVDNGRVRANSIDLQYAGGRGTGTAEIDLRESPRVKSSFDIDFNGIQANRALMGIHSMGSLVSGVFSFKAVGDLLSGPGIDPLKFITVSGDAISTSGMLDLRSFIAPLSGVAAIDLSRLQTVDFKSWTGSYFIRNGRFGTEDWKIASGSGDWDIKGSFGFDGSLDYRARLVIPPAAQKEMKDLQKYGDLVDLFRDEAGNLVLDLDVGGSAKSPKIHLDQSAAKAKAGQKLMDSLKEGAVDKLKDLFKKKK